MRTLHIVVAFLFFIVISTAFVYTYNIYTSYPYQPNRELKSTYEWINPKNDYIKEVINRKEYEGIVNSYDAKFDGQTFAYLDLIKVEDENTATPKTLTGTIDVPGAFSKDSAFMFKLENSQTTSLKISDLIRELENNRDVYFVISKGTKNITREYTSLFYINI